MLFVHYKTKKTIQKKIVFFLFANKQVMMKKNLSVGLS